MNCLSGIRFPIWSFSLSGHFLRIGNTNRLPKRKNAEAAHSKKAKSRPTSADLALNSLENHYCTLCYKAMSEECESTPSLVGSSIRSVDNNHDRPVSTRSTSQSKVKKSNSHHYTTVNELVHEGALVNEEQEYDALLDDAGNVKKDVSRDNVIISANDKENKPEAEAEAEAATAIATKEGNMQDDAEDAEDASTTKDINDDGVEDYKGVVDAQALETEVKIDDSSLKGFVVVDIPKKEPESNPTIYELKNDAAGTDISLEDLIDSQIASISDFSADLQKKVGKKKSTGNKQRKRSNSGVLPDQVIENDAVQQVPAGAPEGVYSPLVQSREQSKIRDSSRSSAAPEKPNLARGDSYTGKTTNELRTGRRSTRDDPLRLLNQSSKDYLRSVSRSRSRISQKVSPTPTQEELEAEGALCNDPEHGAELDQAQNNVIEHVDLQNEVLHEEDEEDVPSGAEVSQLLKEAKEAPLKPIKSLEQKLDESESEDIDNQAEIASAEEVTAPKAEVEKETEEEEVRDVEAITNAPESIGTTAVAESVEKTNLEEVEGTGPDVTEEQFTEEAEQVGDEPESPDNTEENKSDPVLEISESLKKTAVAEVVQEAEEATKEDRNSGEAKEAYKSIVVESEDTTEAEDNVKVTVSGEDKDAEEENAEVSKELKDDKVAKTGPVKPEVKDESEPGPKVKESQPEAQEDASKEAEDEETSSKAEQDENSIVEENENLGDNNDDSVTKDLSQKSSPVKMDSAADVAEKLIQELETEIYGEEGEEREAETESKDIEVDKESPEAEEISVKVETIGKQAKGLEEEARVAAKGFSEEKQLAASEPKEETTTLEPEQPEAAVEEEQEEFHEPTKEEIIEMLKDEPVYIYTSLAGGGFHMPTRTNKLVTILTANRIPFTYRDLGTDEEARNVWRRYSKGRMLPGVVRGKDDIIGNWEEIEEANEDYRVRELIYETL